MIQEFLNDVGFNDKEIKIYLALVSVDSYSVLELSKKTKISRTTIYPIIENLKKKGFISEKKENLKVKYFAESPERLNTFLSEQSLKLEEQQMRLKDIIPQIKSISKESGQAPVLKYYEGREGVLNSLKDFFEIEESEGTAYFVYPLDIISNLFSKKELEPSKKNRTKKNIKGQVIYTSKNIRESDLLSERVRVGYIGEDDPIKCDVMIYKDKVRFITLGNSLSAIYIRNKDVADTLKFLFEEVYKKYKIKKK
ncbi:MAG: hypothetical protein KBD12_00180 [Candidatus Pacebacteria bacterium]|nr:hypothetical protein [Candidatus Paceibacterota bacterium]